MHKSIHALRCLMARCRDTRVPLQYKDLVELLDIMEREQKDAQPAKTIGLFVEVGPAFAVVQMLPLLIGAPPNPTPQVGHVASWVPQ